MVKSGVLLSLGYGGAGDPRRYARSMDISDAVSSDPDIEVAATRWLEMVGYTGP